MAVCPRLPVDSLGFAGNCTGGGYGRTRANGTDFDLLNAEKKG
jgi:hypothetical protein